MVHAIRIHEPGGSENLRYEPVELEPPGPREVQLRQRAAGVNYIDVYHRTGLYPVPLPGGLGLEACGEIVAVGDAVDKVAVGDRVVYLFEKALDGYAQQRNVPVERVVRVPSAVDDDVAASTPVKGLTAWFLTHRSYRVGAGDRLLVHSAAGGVGLLLSQWAASLGAHVVGTAGTPEKRARAARAGCADVLDSRATNLATELRKLSPGRGFDAVYDAVGAATFETSLDALAPHGTLISYGNASGPPPALNLLDLAVRGSLRVTRPRLFDFIGDADEYGEALNEVLARVADGRLDVHVGQTYPLADAAAAHDALESRETTGATVLKP